MATFVAKNSGGWKKSQWKSQKSFKLYVFHLWIFNSKLICQSPNLLLPLCSVYFIYGVSASIFSIYACRKMVYPRKKKDRKEKKLRKTKNFKRAADFNSQPLESRADWQISRTTTGPRAQLITLIFSLIPQRAQKTRVFAIYRGDWW